MLSRECLKGTANCRDPRYRSDKVPRHESSRLGVRIRVGRGRRGGRVRQVGCDEVSGRSCTRLQGRPLHDAAEVCLSALWIAHIYDYGYSCIHGSVTRRVLATLGCPSDSIFDHLTQKMSPFKQGSEGLSSQDLARSSYWQRPGLEYDPAVVWIRAQPLDFCIVNAAMKNLCD